MGSWKNACGSWYKVCGSWNNACGSWYKCAVLGIRGWVLGITLIGGLLIVVVGSRGRRAAAAGPAGCFICVSGNREVHT